VHDVEFVPQVLDLTRLLLDQSLHAGNVLDGFAQDLPFAGLHAPISGKLIAQLIKQILHLLPALPFRKLVADPQLW